MLQQIGDGLKGHKWLTYVVFGALALIFAAWGAYGVANLNFGSSTFVAKVNGHTIPYEDSSEDQAGKAIPDVTALKLPETSNLLHNFGGEACGGMLPALFTVSCDTGFGQRRKASKISRSSVASSPSELAADCTAAAAIFGFQPMMIRASLACVRFWTASRREGSA